MGNGQIPPKTRSDGKTKNVPWALLPFNWKSKPWTFSCPQLCIDRRMGRMGKKEWTYVFDVSRHRKLEFDLRYWPHTMLIHGFVQRKNDVARSWQSARRMSMSVSQFRGGVWHSRRLSIWIILNPSRTHLKISQGSSNSADDLYIYARTWG